MGGTTFGIGSPFTYPTSQLNPFTQMSQPNPFAASPFGTPGFGASPFGGQQPSAHPLQQVLQILQIVRQQLQQLQHLEYLQQQQLQQVQQILQTIPAQLQQLQQLIQFVPQHIHQGQQSQVQQPFGQVPPFGAFSPTAPQWGVSPQVFGPQPSHVM